jgi:hypothetical protein
MKLPWSFTELLYKYIYSPKENLSLVLKHIIQRQMTVD